MAKRAPRERSEKDAAGPAVKPLSEEEAEKAMARFKGLARRVVNVPREKIDAEERAYRDQRPAVKRRRKR